MKKIFKAAAIAVATIVLALCFTACGGNKRENEFMSVNFSPYPYTGVTKVTYYSGESFSKSETCVGLKCYLQDENTEYTYNFSLSNPPSHISYEVSGFDSSVPVESQQITVKFTSSLIPGEITGTFNIKILPPLVTGVEIKDETVIKSTYAVGEQLNYDDILLHVTYGNDTEGDIPVTADMVSGFDTTTASVTQKSFTISYKGENTKRFYYYVAPSANYEVFDGVTSNGIKVNYINCFVPTEKFGYEKKTTAKNTIKWTKSDVSSIEMGFTNKQTLSETAIKNDLTSLGYTNAQIKSCDTYTRVNDGLWGAVCEFARTGFTAEYKAVLFNKTVKISQGGVSLSQEVTVIVIFANYGVGDDEKYAEANEMIETVINSIKN